MIATGARSRRTHEAEPIFFNKKDFGASKPVVPFGAADILWIDGVKTGKSERFEKWMVREKSRKSVNNFLNRDFWNFSRFIGQLLEMLQRTAQDHLPWIENWTRNRHESGGANFNSPDVKNRFLLMESSKKETENIRSSFGNSNFDCSALLCHGRHSSKGRIESWSLTTASDTINSHQSYSSPANSRKSRN